MSITYNKLYRSTTTDEKELPPNIEQIESDESHLKRHDSIVKAKEHLTLQRIKDALSKLIVRKYVDGTIPDDYELCILQNYLSIVNKKIVALHEENPKLFHIVGRLKNVIDLVDGDASLDEKIMKINVDFPEFKAALESIRVLVEDKQVLNEEETHEFKYPDFSHSNYVLSKKIKECIAERRKRKINILNFGKGYSLVGKASQREKSFMDSFIHEDDEKERAYSAIRFSKQSEQFYRDSSEIYSEEHSQNGKRESDPLIKYLLITGIRNNLGNNNESIEKELLNLESTTEFKENLILEIDNPESKRVKSLLNDLRDKIINFDDSKDVKLFRKTPVEGIVGRTYAETKQQKLSESRRMKKLSEAEMFEVIGKFRKKIFHTEEEIDEFVKSKEYKRMVEKMYGKRKGKHDTGMEKKRDSDLLKLISKKLSGIKNDDTAKFELEELDKMSNEGLVNLLTSFVETKHDYQDIESQSLSIQRSVKFHLSKKSSKSTRTGISSSLFYLDEKPSDVVSKDSFLEPGPKQKRPIANSIEEMMTQLTMYDDSNKFKFFKPDLINEKTRAPKTFLRPARYSDLSHLEGLVNDKTLAIFGDKSLSYYFEYSNACIVQLSKDNKLVAFMAVQSDPSVPSLPPSCWDVWIHDLYGIDDCTYTNTMFVRMLLWDEKYENHFLDPFLTYLYINTFMLKQVFLVKPPGVECPSCVEKVFMKINPRKSSSDNCQMLYQNLRHKHIPTLKIRKTAEQDNIDIMPELNRTAPELGRVFGDYLISELVRFSTENRIGLTAFANEKIVGYSLLNTDVCVANLNKYFEVAAFNGFYMHHEKDQFPPGRRTKLIEDYYPTLPETIGDLCLGHTVREIQSESTCIQSSSSFKVDSDKDSSSWTLDRSSSDVTPPPAEVSQTLVFTNDLNETHRHSQLIDKNDLNFQASDKLKINLKHRKYHGILTHHEFRRDLLHMELKMSNPPPIRINRETPREPIYFGEPNVVMIEIFLMLKGVDYRLSYDFLEAIFEVINVDYCILSFPTSHPIPPIVDHFARLIPKTGTWFPHEVYVLHRSYILSSKTVRAANRNDFNNILMLTSKLVNYKKIIEDFLNSQFSYKSSLESYVLLCSDVIVGLCIIDKTPLSLAKLELHFDIEKYMAPSMYKNHGNIKHCCIHPIFSTCSTILFREVIRLSSISCLFYRLYEEDIVNTDLSAPTIISCIGDLIPVIPRQPLQYHSDFAKDNIITTNILSDPDEVNSGFFCSMKDSEEDKKTGKFALFFMNTKYASMLKRCVHLKIVIVGASGTALSFIESLIFRTELEVVYTNIVLVSPNGLPCRQKPHTARDAMRIFRGRYNRDFLTQLGMNAWINIVYGYMTSIDRSKKFITINYDKKINYDYLFLFTGQQFMKPVFHTFNEKFELNSAFFAGDERFTNSYVSECPKNMFLLNSDVDASYSLMTIQKLLNAENVPKEGKFVVYGHKLEAFAVLNALTKFGISTSQIAFVEPFPNEPSETLFNDTAIDEAVLSTLESEGFAVYPRFYLTNWDFDHDGNILTKLYFESMFKNVSIDCFCLYAFDFKSTDLRTFIALINSQLVYDGKLVIDKNFRTNDQYIYSAGPLTRYSRSYYSDHMDHEYYNSIEIGKQVHKSVSHILDSRNGKDDFERRESEEFPLLTDSMGLHQFFQPRIESCQLPGGWNYLRIIKPGKVLPLESQLANRNLKGPTFVTGDCTDKTGPGYFKLVLDHNRIVTEIVCYTHQDIEIHNLIKLYGKHVAVFNNLEQRYNLGTVHDLYEYFRQPWAYAMYHDKFYFIEKKNKRLFYTKLHNDSSKTFAEVITDSLIENEWKDLGIDAVEDLRKLLYNNTKISEEIRGNLKSFLVANELNLPMYINDEYIIVKKDEASKHHLHSDPPLGVTPKTVNNYLALLKKVPEGMTMQEFQNRYFKTFKDESVNTNDRGFCVTSYLSLHSGADTCDNCEQYRKMKIYQDEDDVKSETLSKSPEKSRTKMVDSRDRIKKLIKSEVGVIKSEKYLDFANRKTSAKNEMSLQSPSSSEVAMEKYDGSNTSLNASIDKKSFSQTMVDSEVSKTLNFRSSQESYSKMKKITSGTNLESEITGKNTDSNEKSTSEMKLMEKNENEGKTPSKTRVDRLSGSKSSIKPKSSLLKAGSAIVNEKNVSEDNKLVGSSNLKSDSEIDRKNLEKNTENETDSNGEKISLSKSKTGMNNNQSSSVPYSVDETHIGKPVSSELENVTQNKIGDSSTTKSKKYQSSNTSVDRKLSSESKDGSRRKLDDSKTRETTSSKTTDLNKESTLPERVGSQTNRTDLNKKSENKRESSSYLKQGSVSSKLEELNKKLQKQLEASDKFEVNKYDTISQSSFSPLLLDDLLEHVSKMQNLDMSSFEDVHNVRWKRSAGGNMVADKNVTGITSMKTDVGTSMGTERIGNESRKK